MRTAHTAANIDFSFTFRNAKICFAVFAFKIFICFAVFNPVFTSVKGSGEFKAKSAVGFKFGVSCSVVF